MNDQIKVSEIFHSIQGEGNTMGRPSVFLRLTSCNLLCGNPQIKNLKGRSQEDIYGAQGKNASWTCDTISVWLQGETYSVENLVTHLAKTYKQHFESGSQLVITGGEPMLQQDQLPQLIMDLRERFAYKIRVEVETNGTIIPSSPMVLHVDQFNVSPKLANSGMSKTRRIKYEALEQLSFLSYRDKALFKFVITKPGDINEVLADFIQPFHLPKRVVWLMPGCSTREQFEAVAPMVGRVCQLHGFQFSSRLQINLWNQTTGV